MKGERDTGCCPPLNPGGPGPTGKQDEETTSVFSLQLKGPDPCSPGLKLPHYHLGTPGSEPEKPSHGFALSPGPQPGASISVLLSLPPEEPEKALPPPTSGSLGLPSVLAPSLPTATWPTTG